jgi:hypothetical protein
MSIVIDRYRRSIDRTRSRSRPAAVARRRPHSTTDDGALTDGDRGVTARDDDDDDDDDVVLAHGVDDARKTDEYDVFIDARTTRASTTRGGDDDAGVGRERGFSRVGSRDEEPEAYGY